MKNDAGNESTERESPVSKRTTREDTASGRLSRRSFLGWIGGATAMMTVASNLSGVASLAGLEPGEANAAEMGPLNGPMRRIRAFQIRVDAAIRQKAIPLPSHPTNGDEELYRKKIGNFSKALPHNDLGEVDLRAYSALLLALRTGSPILFEAVPLGVGEVKLANPQASLAFDMEGADSHHLGMVPPPAFWSEEEAGEMTELYWRALARDIPYNNYSSDPVIALAVEDLSQFPRYASVTAESIFRGNTPGDLTGPFISQFLLKEVPYGATRIPQTYRVPVAGEDYMTDYEEWLAIQRGQLPTAPLTYDDLPRYIRNGRDIGEFVHQDFSYQAFLNAALIALGFGRGALDEGNPYLGSANQGGFVTFGPAFILDLVGKVANIALKASWYQKWAVHRRLRPEAFGGRIHNHLTGAAHYPINSKVLNSQALQEVHGRYGTYLLPMAYPEGSPTHPAYPAGHAAIAGACTTVLKAFFKETFIVPNPVIEADDGQSLRTYPGGEDLQLGGELNKLAANIALGRDTAGVHWRSDGIEGLKLGEAVALSILRDFVETYNESFDGFSLTKFDGTTITVK